MEIRLSSKDQNVSTRSGTATVPLQFDSSRRSAGRLSLTIPIILKGTDTAGRTFIEHTQTILISKTGLKTLSKQSLEINGRLQIAVPSRQRVSWGTVSWLGDKKPEGQEIGIALEQTEDFWGVQFPGDSPSGRPTDHQQPSAAPELDEGIAGPEVRRRQKSSSAPDSQDTDLGVADKLSGVLRELADAAVRRSLEEALNELQERAAEIHGEVAREFAARLQESVDQAISQALARIEDKGAEIVSQGQRNWEQALESLTNSTEEKFRAQLEEQQQTTIARMEKFRSELAGKLAAASQALNVE